MKTREGEHSYVIEVKEGYEMKAHRKALKGFVEEIFPNHETPLYYHKRTVVDDDALPDE